MQLNPTKLGKKSYWDEFYQEEKESLEESGKYDGEIWFGQESVDKMVQWAVKHVPPTPNSKLLDIGTGNGILPICLVQAGYSPSAVYGIDYSPPSIELAQRVAEDKSIQGLTFREVDFINGDVLGQLSADPASTDPKLDATTSEGEWDLLLDKGTFDAMALYSANDRPEADTESGAGKYSEHPTDIYPSRVVRLLKPGGFFLLTSCNFTEEEMIAHFTGKEPSLKYHSRVAHRQFTFKGKTGSICSTVAFQKNP